MNLYYYNKNENNPFQNIELITALIEEGTIVLKPVIEGDLFNETISSYVCANKSEETLNAYERFKGDATKLDSLSTSTSDAADSLLKSLSCKAYTPVYMDLVYQGK